MARVSRLLGATVKRCGWVKRRIAEYVDGELCAHSSQLVREHLERCPSCMAEYRARRECWDFLISEAPRIVSDPRGDLTWEETAPLLEKAVATRTDALSGIRGAIIERCLAWPRHLASMAAFRTRTALLPAAGVFMAILVMFLFSKAQKSPAGARSENPPIVIRIAFQPAGAKISNGYMRDAGQKFGVTFSERGEMRHGWH